MLRQIGLELARRGHNVTVITANKEKNPPKNYHEVMVDDKKIWEVIGKLYFFLTLLLLQSNLIEMRKHI